MAAKTIIVTGAGRGIGLAVSQYLLKNSHKVVLVARTETELEALKKQYPAQVEYLAADLTKLEVRTIIKTMWTSGKRDKLIDKSMTERYEGHRPCCETRWED